ncbi:MAG: hypothetical protein LZF61_03405 [Nitrosomonas sp.]|nr:MAG: hypothetical protein LZF61_03405 [Nitrosomonas sp.]
MRYPETQTSHDTGNYLKQRENRVPFYEVGQLRRAKMHAARLIEALDDKKVLTPSLHQLLEASIILETTDSRILAAWLKRTPAMVRADFQKICTSLTSHHTFSKNTQSNSIA